jgi:hypothetical protein
MDFRLSLLLPLVFLIPVGVTAEDDLVAHWKLTADARDASGAARDATNHGVTFDAQEGAFFNGIDSWLEVPADKMPRLGTGSFTLTAWVHTEEDLDDVLGDALSWYDPETRNGFNLTLMNYAGVTCAQSNWRNVLFGIDAAQGGNEWVDCGRPGNNQLINSLVVFDGDLYCSTWEPAANDRGRVYRYAGGKQWIDCGAPDPANCIKAMAVYRGKLYVGSELYSGGGSSLPLSPNMNHGGTVYRYEGGTEWTNCGKVADVRSISGLAVFDGKLYAGTGTTGAWRDTPRTRGMYRFDGIGQWTDCGCPGLRITHLGVHNGHLFGLSYDDGGFFRYAGGTEWEALGPVPETTQVYSMMVYEGRLHVGTWPTGSVYRLDEDNTWTHTGRLGEEKEVMAVSVYNGKFYAGTLPFANVYRYDGPQNWTDVGRLDLTPAVRYRRAWSMAVFDGKLYCGVLPSGHVLSLEAGKSVTYDKQLAPGWQHLAAVRDGATLSLYVNGRLASKSEAFDQDAFDLGPDQPLKIGLGQHDYFNGRLKDVRIYRKALSAEALRELSSIR